MLFSCDKQALRVSIVRPSVAILPIDSGPLLLRDVLTSGVSGVVVNSGQTCRCPRVDGRRNDAGGEYVYMCWKS
jgi:hypothetical protein